MNLTFNATPVITSSLAVNVLLNILDSGLLVIKRFGAPFTENHFVLNDLVVNQRPSKLGQFIVLTSEDAEILQQPLEEGNSRLLLLGAESGNLVMAFDLPEEEIQQKLVPMLGNGFPLMRSFTPPQVKINMAPPIQPWNNPMPLQGAMGTQRNLNNVLNMINYNPEIVQVKKSGEIISKKNGTIGAVRLILKNTNFNLHQAIEKFLSETLEAIYLSSWSTEYREVVVAQIVGVYLSNMVDDNGTVSISNPLPFNGVGIRNVLGKTVIITINDNTISYVLEP